jgi:hypothetical protein
MPYPSGSLYPDGSLYPGFLEAVDGDYSDTYSDYYTDSLPVEPSRPAVAMWTPRVRDPDLSLTDPFLFSELVLIERYNQPDTLSVTGNIDHLRPALQEGSGIYLVDDTGRPRFSGFATSIERRGDKTATIVYTGDLQVLWDRICWPTPTAAWTAQTTAYDTQTAVHETRILGYITRNAGSTAFTGGGVDRRVTGLRIPSSQDRGTSGTTTARFQNLGQLVAELSEAANLRTRIMFTPEGGSDNFLDVIVDHALDISAWAGFGDGYAGGPGLLGEDWRYLVGPGVSTVLSAAGGELENRSLHFQHDSGRRSTWRRHIEFFVDQRDTTDANEITEGMATAMAENAPTVEIEAPVIAGNLEFGPGEDAIPVGAKVAVSLDGELVYERIRQITTTVSLTSGQETVRIEPTIGTPDAGLPVEHKLLLEALKKLRTLESI